MLGHQQQKVTGIHKVRSFQRTNHPTFSISTAFALMASKRRAFKSSSGVNSGSALAAATSSDSAADAGVWSWRAKGEGSKLGSPGLETDSGFKVFQIETSLLSYRCRVLVCMCVLLCMPAINRHRPQ